MKLDPNNSKPIFLQVAELIEDLILEGELMIDDQVYSTNQLSKIYTINPATARKGLNILIDEEIIYKKRGVGMFVSEHSKEIILKKRKGQFFDQYIFSMMSEAMRLGLNKADVIKLINDYEEV